MARKEKVYHFIYKTTNVLTGRYYYGMHSTDNLNDGYLGSGRRLRYSINKYGKDAHTREIVEFCDDRSSLKKRETELVNLNEIAKENCINLRVGGEGGFIHENQIINGKKANIKFLSLMENIEYREEFAKKVSASLKKYYKNHESKWKNRKHSEESKKRIGISNSVNQKGEKNSQYNTCWITNGFKNKKIKKNGKIPQGWYLGRKI